MLLGTQLFLTGFLGELIIRHSNDRNHYEIGILIINDDTAALYPLSGQLESTTECHRCRGKEDKGGTRKAQ